MIKIYPYNRKPFYYETDQMGIVHHSNYIRWFEETRLDLMDQAGFTYNEMENLGVLIPVLEVNCKYINYIGFNDEVSIYCKVDSFTGIKMTLSYEIYRNKDNVLCATGNSMHCFVNKDMKILRVKRDFPAIYNFFNELVDNEIRK